MQPPNSYTATGFQIRWPQVLKKKCHLRNQTMVPLIPLLPLQFHCSQGTQSICSEKSFWSKIQHQRLSTAPGLRFEKGSVNALTGVTGPSIHHSLTPALPHARRYQIRKNTSTASSASSTHKAPAPMRSELATLAGRLRRP